MIVATAGHIDHGKTALVRALTGIDADRLPEERARGITLDLGFAYARSGTTSLGFVDVPGHERLVRTMVAGVTGVDHALLVVAADDGIMPQTREHLAILDLLELARGLVAITKCDRVDARRSAAVAADVRAMLAGTSLAGAPILPCSARTGEGIGDLARHLDGAASEAAACETGENGEAGFRLAVDRGFTLPGVGLVVTGAVHAGTVRVGDRLTLSPRGLEVRVRGVRAQNEAVEAGRVGERCALNVVAPRLSRADVHRGDWLVAPALHAPTTRLDVRLRLLPSEARALRHRTPVQVHLGAAAVTGRVLLGEGQALDPGDAAIAQVSLDAAIGALARDGFVLRDVSARRTLGGGRVIDPFGPRRGARTPARRAALAALEAPDAAEALAGLLAAYGAQDRIEGRAEDEIGGDAKGAEGIDLDRFRLARNLGPEAEAALFARVGLVAVAGPTRRLGFAAQRLAALAEDLVVALDALHAEAPDNPGLSADELAASVPRALHPALRPALDGLVAEGRLARSGALFHRPGHVVRLAMADAALWAAVRAVLERAGLDQPRLTLLAEAVGRDPDDLRGLLDRLGRIGWVCRISRAYYLLPEAVAGLAAIARTVAGEHPEGLLTVGRFREAAGIGRNLTMPVLEHFDAIGLTVRIHEGRRVRAGG